MIRALLLALALAGCEGQVHVESVPIAQADPTKEADWPGRVRTYWPDLHIGPLPAAYSSRRDSIAGYPYPKDSLTVTNATPRTLLLEQAHVVTLAKPGDSLTVALEGSVTIREEASYDE